MVKINPLTNFTGNQGDVPTKQDGNEFLPNAPSGGASSINDLSDAKTDSTSVFLGSGAGANDDGDNYNTAVGINALNSITNGEANTAIGSSTLQNANGACFYHVAVGYEAMQNYANDYFLGGNVAVGFRALKNANACDSNVAVGRSSLVEVTSGANNIGVGSNAGTSSSPFYITTESNRVVIGNNNITNAYIKVAWTITSDKRDKTDINPIHYGLDFVKMLKPVSFYRDERDNYIKKGIHIKDGSLKDKKKQLGFIAQDIIKLEKKFGAKHNNDLCIADAEQRDKLKIQETALIPVLVKAIQEQQTQIEYLLSKINSDTQPCCEDNNLKS